MEEIPKETIDEPIFNFTIAESGPMLVYGDTTEEQVKQLMYDEITSENIIIPQFIIRDKKNEEFQDIQKGMKNYPKLKDKKLECLIIPIRYTKVFKS